MIARPNIDKITLKNILRLHDGPFSAAINYENKDRNKMTHFFFHLRYFYAKII